MVFVTDITESFLLFIFLHIASLDTAQWYDADDFRLPRREPVEVGFTRDIQVNLGTTHQMKTLSVKPPIFEIPKFLSPEECEYLVYQAKQTGLKDSPLHPDEENFQTTQVVFNKWDVDNSSFVEPDEFTYIKGKGNLYLTEIEVMEMLEALEIDKDGNNRMDYNEFLIVTAEKIRAYFNYFITHYPRLRSRYSQQSWLWHYGAYDHFLEGFHERISRLTLLPHEIIEMSEPMQVVKYEDGGHYHCHHDSDEIDDQLPCCTYKHIQDDEKCRQCRYLTVMFFLNNVTSNGETAFQLADNKTFSYKSWEKEAPKKCDLMANCYDSNLVIQPVQGTALLWYNHKVDPITGWFGEMDSMTYHGGCEVRTSEKWIANTWLNIIGQKGRPESYKGWLSNDRPLDEL